MTGVSRRPRFIAFDNPRGFASGAPNPVLERSGRFIYRRRYAVIVAWAVLVLAVLPFAPRAREFLKPGGFTNENFQSVKARRVLQDQLDVSVISVELIFVSREWTAYEPEFIEAVQTALTRVEALDDVTGVTTHLGAPERVSDDGHTVRVSVELDLPLDESVPYLDTVIGAVEPGPLDMIVTGGPALYRDISIASESDLRRGEAIAFPLATLALLLVFGTLVAAITPAAVGGAVVAIGLGAVFFLSMGIDMSIFALNIVTLLGIGIGIDYSLFYTSRFREELRAGLSVEDAVAVAQSLAGRAIMFSAVTSFIGLVSLTAFDIMMLRSVGIGALVVIGSALIAATTLLPALLGVLGHRIDRLRIGPDWAKGRSIWKPLASRVMARPILVLIPTTIFLVLLALPVKDLRLGTVDATVVPKSLESRQGFDVLREEFGLAVSTVIPVAYTLEGDPLAAENIEHLYAFGRAVEQLDHVETVSSIVNLSPSFGPDQYRLMYSRPEAVTDARASRLLRESVRPGAVLFLVQSPLHPFSTEAQRLVGEIRALDPGPGRQVYVDGGSADLKDIVDGLYSRFPWVIAFVLGVTYLSLMFLFRSFILPLKAVLLNSLSILASYGALVFIIQQGHFSGVLGFEPLGSIEATTPILLFAIVFGLSMDYEIFLLARVAEAWRRTGDNRTSVIEGLQKSGLIITGAGGILIVVAASFVAADIVVIKALGLGLAISVLVDVTIVRGLVAPALMRVFGRWNWWFPEWLDRRMPDVSYGA